jgi:hypothetical protein
VQVTALPKWTLARLALGCALLFALTSWMYDVGLAMVLAAAVIGGFCSEAFLVRRLAALLKGQRITAAQVLFTGASIGLDVVIILFGYGITLGLVFACFFIVDALVFRFR